MTAEERGLFTTRMIEAVERDKKTREKRDRQYAEGLKKAGLDGKGVPAFENASTVHHPILAECCVDYMARVSKELLPPEQLVKFSIRPEAISPKTEAKARRKQDHMNWQLLRESPSLVPEFEKLLSQQPMAGDAFMRVWYDRDMQRFEFQFYPVDWVYIPYGARSFYAARRKTFLEPVSAAEYRDRIEDGTYREVPVPPHGATQEKTRSEESADRTEGKEEDSLNEDGDRKLYLSLVMERLPRGLDPLARKRGPSPYVCTIDPDTNELLELRRNWEEGDPRFEAIEWFVEFPFIPWRGAYSIGMPQLIAGLSTAMTGVLRAILDSGLVNTMPTLLKLKGRPSGGNTRLDATGVHEIEGQGAEDINKVFKQLQFNPPSPMLFEVLGFLDRTARNVVKTSLEDMAEYNTNVPVGTQLSRVEQGLMTFSSIFARQHFAMAQLLKTVHKLNSIYLGPDEDDETEQRLASKYRRNSTPVQYDQDDPERVVYCEDYRGSCEMVPVSDPRIFSDSQRLAQMQAVDAIDMQNPGIINKMEKVRRQLSLLRVPDYEALIVKQPQPQQTNQAAENVAMAMGQPVLAFPQQDHLAHIQVLLKFWEDPVYGKNPAIEPTFLPAAVNHLKEHLLYFYSDMMDKTAQDALGFDPMKLIDPSDPNMIKMLDGLTAATANLVHEDTDAQFGQVLPIIREAVQKVQQYQQAQLEQMLQDPAAKVMAAEVNRKARNDQAVLEDKDKERQVRTQIEMTKMAAKAQETEAKNRVTIQTNTQDNSTQLAIAGTKAREAGAGIAQRAEADRGKLALDAHKHAVETMDRRAEAAHGRQMDHLDAVRQAGEAAADRLDRAHDRTRDRMAHNLSVAEHEHGRRMDVAQHDHQRRMDVAEHGRQVEADRAKAKNDAAKAKAAAKRPAAPKK